MSHRRLHWTVAAVALVTGFVGVTVGAALASHQFADVSDASPFHDAIDNVNDAGCVSGFPDGSFRPTENVRRQQAAFWLDACLGRGDAVFGEDSFLVGPGGDTSELELDVASGGLANVGSGGWWLVIADVDVDTSGDQQSTWTLELLDSPGPGMDEVLDDQVVTVVDPGNIALNLNPSDGATLMGFVSAEPDGSETFRLSGQRNGGVPLANIRTTLTAVWMPFDADVLE